MSSHVSCSGLFVVCFGVGVYRFSVCWRVFQLWRDWNILPTVLLSVVRSPQSFLMLLVTWLTVVNPWRLLSLPICSVTSWNIG